MLYINPDWASVKEAKLEFHKNMTEFVYNRIDNIKKIKNIDNAQVECFFDLYINDKLDDILIGVPETFVKINQNLNPLIEKNKGIKAGVEYVFNYDIFVSKKLIKYDAYNLADSLDIRTCTYCNRNYTNTVIHSNGKKITRPQFDHFIDKGTNPLLAISFFNLIPSCSICNSGIKGSKKVNLREYLHPYLDNDINDIKFTYRLSKGKHGHRIVIKTPDTSKAKKTVELFALEEIYNSHTGELLDLLQTKQHFSDKYLSILDSNLLRGVIVSKEEMYRIVFGTEYHSENFINRPFSKFKSDILKELGII
ncbi:hypothetical protein [Dyadobacter frigoris]|uniref:HNH endonuclease n=1 Tax=Dyadobacter frigoris TaxID=2576211 RepID=A0A4U6D953_9BACT|nr:hypothetical protein [Dyadobacter frigoris]TKT94042.1 hypothetical protein FDK13_02200 [Dyadobacter frigoris]